ncbi:MAG TPA: UvrD-helicase domain-containing protein [Kofleriaceae bacterium]|nr:UvrD-helicase domain-containing protein [Kofleriaceae bacterium]
MSAPVRWPRPPSLGDAHAPLLVVEASAGTGKTWFLERRVVDLVLRAGATIDQILVVTFTEKATAELRSRVRGQLSRMVHGQPEAAPPGASPDDVWVIDDAARARLRAALDTFDAAPISTIHGFCHRVLAEESFAARRPFEQEQIPDDAALRSAFTAALRERFALDPVEAALLGEYLGDNGNTVDKLFRLVLEVYRSGAAIEPARAGAKADEVLVPRLVEEVIARADRTKQREGQLDFQDMLRLTAAALEGPGGASLAARIATRHPWALIDEFQDTDPLQWQIFQRVWGGSSTPAGARGPARGLTVVGDPKQAIYSFRGGDVHTYLQATGELRRRDAAIVHLDQNQRSTAPMVCAVNCILKQPKEVFSGDIRYDRPVTAAGNVTATWADGRPVEPLALLQFDDRAGKIVAGEFRKAVAEASADEIARLLGDPARRITGTRKGVASELRASDILVLTRTNDEAYDVADAIRRRGVPCALARAEYLFETAEARAVADVLDAVARPRDRTARLRAWMSCFFDVDPDDLGRALEVPDDHVMAARLHDWRHHAVRMDYPRLFAAILADSRVAERALATGRGERIVTNIHHVFEHLHAEVERSRCELPELVARLRAWIRAARIVRPDDSDVQRQETDRDAVQVMTVHRAKGLEAWVVFVAGLVMFQDRQEVLHSFHDASGVRRIAVKSNEEAKRLAAEDKTAEDARLAYVALTRARARLYLAVLPDQKDSKTKVRKPRGGWKGAYACIHDNLLALAAKRKELPGLADVWPAAEPVGPDLDVGALALPAIASDVAPLPDLAAREQVGWVVTSYTRLRDQERATAAAAAAASGARVELEAAMMTGEDRSFQQPGPHDLPGGAETGQYLHEVLEHVDFAAALREAARGVDAWLARPEITQTFALAERNHGVDPAHRRLAAKMVWDAITEPPLVMGAPPLRPLGEAAKLAREVEFVYPVPGDEGRGFVKGFIDLIVTWPGDDRWYVVDYKSDMLDVSIDAPRAQVDAHYLVQAELYALACARMLGVRDAAQHETRFGGLLYWFLRSRRVVHLAPTFADLERYRANLAGRPVL